MVRGNGTVCLVKFQFFWIYSSALQHLDVIPARVSAFSRKARDVALPRIVAFAPLECVLHAQTSLCSTEPWQTKVQVVCCSYMDVDVVSGCHCFSSLSLEFLWLSIFQYILAQHLPKV